MKIVHFAQLVHNREQLQLGYGVYLIYNKDNRNIRFFQSGKRRLLLFVLVFVNIAVHNVKENVNILRCGVDVFLHFLTELVVRLVYSGGVNQHKLAVVLGMYAEDFCSGGLRLV